MLQCGRWQIKIPIGKLEISLDCTNQRFPHIFHEITELISNCRFEFIKWPTPQEQENTKKKVFEESNFPNCVGFVDGCHIQIVGPPKNPVDYYNRKETHSIILQGICDETLKFTNIHLGHTGRAHDARVFRESDIGEELEHLIDNDNHILGDSAYTLSSRLLTPYRDNGHLTEAQRKFNKVHASARAYIERAFGRLKGKFRRLKYLELHKTENISQVVSAACVLHNFILLNEFIYNPRPVNEEMPLNLQNLGGNANIICIYFAGIQA